MRSASRARRFAWLLKLFDACTRLLNVFSTPSNLSSRSEHFLDRFKENASEEVVACEGSGDYEENADAKNGGYEENDGGRGGESGRAVRQDSHDPPPTRFGEGT